MAYRYTPEGCVSLHIVRPLHAKPGSMEIKEFDYMEQYTDTVKEIGNLPKGKHVKKGVDNV